MILLGVSRWITILLVGVVTSLSILLILLSRVARKIELKNATKMYSMNKRSVKLPFENSIDRWLKQSHVKSTAKQFYFMIFALPLASVIFGYVVGYPIVGVLGGLYFVFYLISNPIQKRKRLNMSLELQVRRTEKMMSKLYNRGINIYDLMSIVSDVIADGEYKNYLESTIKRANTVETLSEALFWLSDELAMPSLHSLAIALSQGSMYRTNTLGDRLITMSNKEREKVLIHYDKISDVKRMNALVEASIFIVLPMIAVLLAFVFYFVLMQFSLAKI